MIRTRLSVSIGLAVVAAVASAITPASAALAAQNNTSKAKTTFCEAVYNAGESSEAAGPSVARALEASDFSTERKQLLFYFEALAKDEQKNLALLHAAPAKVRAAVAQNLSVVEKVGAVVRKSKNANGLSSSPILQSEQAKAEAAEKTLSAYHLSKCGTAIQ